jgi:hypothetical protein
VVLPGSDAPIPISPHTSRPQHQTSPPWSTAHVERNVETPTTQSSQTLAVHLYPVAHVTPQAPQLAASLVRSTHDEPHGVHAGPSGPASVVPDDVLAPVLEDVVPPAAPPWLLDVLLPPLLLLPPCPVLCPPAPPDA